MTQSKWIGRALGLALCTAALTACQQGNSSTQDSNASGQAPGITLDQKAEKQLRDAIAQAPQHGLKPELFLKGGETGDALVQAGLKYASALANGYTDPKKLHEVYTIPRPKTDVRAGMSQAIQNGNVGEWLNSLAPQTPEYKALSQAFIQYAKLAQDIDPPADSRGHGRSSPARKTRASPPSSLCCARAVMSPRSSRG